MNFSQALTLLKKGFKMKRKNWNGKDQFVVAMEELKLPAFNTQDTTRKVNDRTAKFIGKDTPLNSRPYFVLFNQQKEWQPGWLPSQGDLFANDWEIIEEKEGEK